MKFDKSVQLRSWEEPPGVCFVKFHPVGLTSFLCLSPAWLIFDLANCFYPNVARQFLDACTNFWWFWSQAKIIKVFCSKFVKASKLESHYSWARKPWLTKRTFWKWLKLCMQTFFDKLLSSYQHQQRTNVSHRFQLLFL